MNAEAGEFSLIVVSTRSERGYSRLSANLTLPTLNKIQEDIRLRPGVFPPSIEHRRYLTIHLYGPFITTALVALYENIMDGRLYDYYIRRAAVIY
jgi:hypothetical protein